MKQSPPLLVRLLLALTSRYSIVLINVLLVAIGVLSLKELAPLLFNAQDNTKEMEDIVENLGVILIGYGVAIEERHAFMNIFRLYPEHEDKTQAAVDHHCHEYGLCYLLLGLFMEVCVALVKLPNSIVDTSQEELLLFGIGAVLLAWSAWLMLRHCAVLLRPGRFDAPEGHGLG
ncbi:hypothetical protein NNJEOMEG_01895 [Fundidesulfovibrio magnetotacticus]|uniref:Uncharacterized protein n=1 Tax=Fundidesulfovibrio magnetotacticus TaxID=2730080 RepID=A0A6V8LW66_9BACT|nr:hypothetical protein [Fundidesulfovibrio magnetotacticus]GFK94056.1 hypothetical protein NNJEOMEG_01895 [Fundidesulfovibrio magnetotacticus]